VQSIPAFGAHTRVLAHHNKCQINDTALTLTDIKPSIAMSRRRDSRRQTSSFLTLLSSSYPAG
jgi:hypothetical protein